MTILRAGEGVMHRVPALGFGVVFEHREINHPQWPPFVAGEMFFLVADLDAQRANGVVDDLGFVGTEENHVAIFCAGALDDGFERLGREILHNR